MKIFLALYGIAFAWVLIEDTPSWLRVAFGFGAVPLALIGLGIVLRGAFGYRQFYDPMTGMTYEVTRREWRHMSRQYRRNVVVD